MAEENLEAAKPALLPSYTREALPRTGLTHYSLFQLNNERRQAAFNQKSFVLPKCADERLATLISVCQLPLVSDAQLKVLHDKAEADALGNAEEQPQHKDFLVDVYEFATERYPWMNHEPVITGEEWERLGPEGFFFAGAGFLSALSLIRNFNPLMAGLGAVFGGSIAITGYTLGLLYKDPNHLTLRYRDLSYWEKGPLHSRTRTVE